MPYKWVLNAFLHCDTLVKINKTREMRHSKWGTLGKEERHSASTKTESEHEVLTYIEQFLVFNTRK